MPINLSSYNKYGNKKITIDNITFDSKKEAGRYANLKLLLRAGKIRDLQIQPEFVILPPFTDVYGKKHAGVKYIADFSYWEIDNPGPCIVEDVKGALTDVYKLKLKFFLHQYPHFIFREI